MNARVPKSVCFVVTQAFYDDPNVLFISIHQDGMYPRTHAQGWSCLCYSVVMNELSCMSHVLSPLRATCRAVSLLPAKSGLVPQVGSGAGEGYNINIPIPPGSGIGCYEAATARVIVPALEAFAPDLILVSCGFDAAAFDPLAHCMLNSRAFANLAMAVKRVADRCCNGRLILAHEGGYSATAVPYAGLRGASPRACMSSRVFILPDAVRCTGIAHTCSLALRSWYACMYECVNECMFLRVRMYMCMCMCICVYVYLCVCVCVFVCV
jgi:hypothetical protein